MEMWVEGKRKMHVYIISKRANPGRRSGEQIIYEKNGEYGRDERALGHSIIDSMRIREEATDHHPVNRNSMRIGTRSCKDMI